MSVLKNVVVRKARVVRKNSPLEDLADYENCIAEIDDSADEKYKIRKIFQMSYPKVAADPTFVLFFILLPVTIVTARIAKLSKKKYGFRKGKLK